MQEILSIIAAIFGLIALAFFAVRSRALPLAAVVLGAAAAAAAIAFVKYGV